MQVNIANHECPICWDGIYYFALSDYPHISAWELKKLLAFLKYEEHHGRQTKIVCEDSDILSAINNAVAHPETVESAPLPAKITECRACMQKGCITSFVCHTATIDNAKKILASGKLLSAVRAFDKSADELVADRRNAAKDPTDYFDYIMLAWGNCQAGDRLVMERIRGGNPSEDDYGKNFSPGVRFYFRYEDIIKHPRYVFDGHHPAKIKDELVLSDYLYACIIPKKHKKELEPLVKTDIADKTHFIAQGGLGLWDWTNKVYDFIEGKNKMNLFTGQIDNWDDWGDIFQLIPAFAPLVEHIFQKENLPMSKIENLCPGSNAVFKVGEYVIKIFAPQGMGQDYGTDVDVELFGMRWANMQGIPSPKLIAEGTITDKYRFRYMIMEYIHAKMLSEIEENLSYEEKVSIGMQIRSITDKLNVPCKNFTPVDVVQYAIDNDGWDKEGFPMSFQEERLAYLANFSINEGEKIFCHGDWTCENILVDDKLNVYLIDFADAMYAPAEYDSVYIASALFCFEKPYMTGYFGDYDVGDIVNLCMTWLPVHAYGSSTTEGNLESTAEITSFAVMREHLYELVKLEAETKRKKYIESDMLYLAEAVESDYKILYDSWNDEDTVWGYNYKLPYAFDEYCKKFKNLGNWGAVIVRCEDNTAIGRIGLSMGLPDLTITIFKPYRGQGYGKAAFLLGVKYCFEILHLDKIYAGAYEDNIQSRKMIERCGFLPNPEGNAIEPHIFSGEDRLQLDFVIKNPQRAAK